MYCVTETQEQKRFKRVRERCHEYMGVTDYDDVELIHPNAGMQSLGQTAASYPALVRGRPTQLHIGDVLCVSFFDPDHPLYVAKINRIFQDPVYNGSWLRITWYMPHGNRYLGTYNLQKKRVENLLLEKRIQRFPQDILPDWALIHWGKPYSDSASEEQKKQSVLTSSKHIRSTVIKLAQADPRLEQLDDRPNHSGTEFGATKMT
jgi:hypothetical protein